MPENDYQTICARFPPYIPLGTVSRPQRPALLPYREITAAGELPDRLVFGDLLPETFTLSESGWEVRYRDGDGNGIDLHLDRETLKSTSYFLGESSFSIGTPTQDALQFRLSLAGEFWAETLKHFLESRYPLVVFGNGDEDLFIPDGWGVLFMVPVTVDQLPDVVRFHDALEHDPQLRTYQAGELILLSSATNYVEGAAPAGCADSMDLMSRHLHLFNTPVTYQPVRETSGDAAAWTFRRSAYVYRLSSFMRDAPRIAELLKSAGLLSAEPDLTAAAIVAHVARLTASDLYWTSPDHGCRSTWIGSEFDVSHFKTYVPSIVTSLVQAALDAAWAHAVFCARSGLPTDLHRWETAALTARAHSQRHRF